MYEGKLFSIDKKGKIYDTGVNVYSGATKDSDKNTISDETWESKDYTNAKEKLKK